MEVLAIREGDLDYPDEMLLPFLVNGFTDENGRLFERECREVFYREMEKHSVDC
jgi:hypothetical protein